MSFPDMSQEHGDWAEPVSFTVVTKSVVDHEVSEALATPVVFEGIFYQFTAREINFKIEGQRSWKWWHLVTSQDLDMDTIVAMDGVNYRVWQKKDWSRAGYYEYELAESYRSI